MTYRHVWRRAYVAAKLALVGAVAAGFMAVSGPVQALTIVSGFGMSINDTVSLSIGDVYGAEIRGDAGDAGDSFFLGFTATEGLLTVETNTINPLDGFVDPFIEWNTAPDGGGSTLASLTSAELTAGINTSMMLSLLPGETRYLIVSWSGISEDLSNWDIRVEAVPLPAGLLLFLSGLAGVGVLGRYKAKRREPAAA